MAQTEFEKGNKMIAEFVGHKLIGKPEWEYEYWLIEGNNYRGDELKYHTSWDWLMPVVEKIEGLNFGVNIYQGNGCHIFSYGKCIDENTTIGFAQNCKFKIESVWRCVVQFIYNQKNK